MALTTREKKLAVGWLASKATEDFLANNYCSEEIRDKLKQNNMRLYLQITSGFSESEIAELVELDKQIPKD